jgi:glucan phosphoethanolaminetransferase (alkaline phosphatase superfamily)
LDLERRAANDDRVPAAPQAIEPRFAVRLVKTASLLAVLVVAKAFVLWGRDLPHSMWVPVAYLWHDMAVVLVFAAVELVAPRRWITTALYWVVVTLVAINVPVTRVMSSPVTLPMLRATGETLSASIGHYVTVWNLASIAAILGLGWLVPARLDRARLRASGARPSLARASLAMLPIVILTLVGAWSMSRVDTAGLERNALSALTMSAFPRVHSGGRSSEWRVSPFAAESVGSDSALARLRGIARGRNVLMIVLESTGASYLAPYGASLDPTPRLTALATGSLFVERAYASYPESVKGLVATLASRYPAFGKTGGSHAPLMATALAHALGTAGYQSALFHSGRFRYLGMDTLVGAAGFDLAADAGDIGGNHNSSFGIDEGAAVRRILGWIDARARDRPFLVTYLPIAGHHPYASFARPRFPGTEDIDRYRNALYEGDLSIGALLDGLRSRGLDTTTLIAVIGDHGEAFEQHPGNVGHSLAIYEENIRVPMFFAAPGVSLAHRVTQTASLVDLSPTILELLGIAAPHDIDGQSMLDGKSRMALFFTDYSLALLGLRDGCFKYIYEVESRRSRLFDLCADPGERIDVGRRYPERVIAYRDRVRAWGAGRLP